MPERMASFLTLQQRGHEIARAAAAACDKWQEYDSDACLDYLVAVVAEAEKAIQLATELMRELEPPKEQST